MFMVLSVLHDYRIDRTQLNCTVCGVAAHYTCHNERRHQATTHTHTQREQQQHQDRVSGARPSHHQQVK